MLKGRCLCGSVAYEAAGKPLWVAYCHCASCRRHVASPVALFVGVTASNVRWTGAEPATYASSPDVERSFCPTCGTPIAYASAGFPGELHLYHGTLEGGGEVLPQCHVHAAEQLPWFEIQDDLPRYERAARESEKPLRVAPRHADSDGG